MAKSQRPSPPARPQEAPLEGDAVVILDDLGPPRRSLRRERHPPRAEARQPRGALSHRRFDDRAGDGPQRRRGPHGLAHQSPFAHGHLRAPHSAGRAIFARSGAGLAHSPARLDIPLLAGREGGDAPLARAKPDFVRPPRDERRHAGARARARSQGSRISRGLRADRIGQDVDALRVLAAARYGQRQRRHARRSHRGRALPHHPGPDQRARGLHLRGRTSRRAAARPRRRPRRRDPRCGNGRHRAASVAHRPFGDDDAAHLHHRGDHRAARRSRHRAVDHRQRAQRRSSPSAWCGSFARRAPRPSS